jgi:hypothetical protein
LYTMLLEDYPMRVVCTWKRAYTVPLAKQSQGLQSG